MRRKTSGALSLPGAVIIAGALIAVALIWINRPADRGWTPKGQDNAVPQSAAAGFAEVTAADHILGNPNAPIKLIEYSDLSCPYCKLFNPTLTQIMDIYGPTGKVAWVYRHFPLFKPINGEIPHPNSLMQSEALECVGQLGGNKAFFDFEKKWFDAFPTDGANRNAVLDRQVIDGIARDIGIDPASFDDCMSSSRFKDRIDKAYEDGLRAGISGTPFTVVITPSGNKIPLVGIQTYSTLKATIDTLITTIASTTDIQN